MMSFGLSVLRSQPLPEPVGMGLFPVSHNTQHTQHTAHNRQRERERVRVRERESNDILSCHKQQSETERGTRKSIYFNHPSQGNSPNYLGSLVFLCLFLLFK